jgi:hypothetical protein
MDIKAYYQRMIKFFKAGHKVVAKFYARVFLQEVDRFFPKLSGSKYWNIARRIVG